MLRTKHFFAFFILFLGIVFFLSLKISNLGIRLSDTNIYFLTSFNILQGKVLYKDIFFTNLPLFPYISSFYFLITKGNLPVFYLTSAIEVSIISLLIYCIVFAKTKDKIVSVTSSFLYLFSFIVLSTSDHQTGVFSASLLMLLSYVFLGKNKYFVSGLFAGLCLLTKIYFIPIAFSFIFFIMFAGKKGELKKLDFFKLLSFRLFYFLVGLILISAAILIPSYIFSKGEILNNLLYSFSRLQGLSKSHIFSFFIIHDFFLFMLLIFNLFNYKKNLLFSFISFFSIVFLFYYQDIYYLYLNFFIPFLALSFFNFNSFIKEKLNPQRMVIPTIVVIAILINFLIYVSSYKNLQKVEGVRDFLEIIKKEKTQYLYGINDVTPALSYLTNVNLLENIIDTNENIFKKKILNKTILTKKAIQNKTMIVSYGAYYPTMGIEEILLSEIFEKNLVLKKCNLVYSSPIKSEGMANRLNLLKCFK